MRHSAAMFLAVMGWVLLVPLTAYPETGSPGPLDNWSMGAGEMLLDTAESASPLYNGNPELQHYNWNANMTNGECGYCHVATGLFLPVNYRKDAAGFCISCHDPAGMGHEKGLYGKHRHSILVNATSAGRKKPAYGNITAGEYNNQPFSRLKDGYQVVCATCHNAMRKTEDPGRTWEYTTTTDRKTYALQNGGWSAYGYMVPSVYRDTNLWSGPTYSKDKKSYLVNPSEYTYDEAAGTVTFKTAQSSSVYIYVSLDYPYLRASSEDNRLCSDCHTEATHREVNCLTCHQAHNTDNLADIRANLRTTNRTSITVRFLRYTGANSFADGDATHNGVCEVCHTQTKYYKRDGTGFVNHSGGWSHDRENCTMCHGHSAGFAPGYLGVRIDSPFANSTTHEYSVMIRGTITGREGAEVGVTVNGVLAEVYRNSFALADLPLADGANNVTAVATDAYGMTASQTITVNVVNPAASTLSISASPSSGPAPLTVTFSIESAVPGATLFELDYEGDGVVDASATTLDGLTSYLTHVYTNNGLYYPTFKVTDNTGKVYKKSTTVNVKSLPDFVGMWNTFRTYIGQGRINDAVKFISNGNRENYRTNLTTLSQMSPQALQNTASDMADMQIYQTGEGYALGDFRFIQNGQVISFGVQFKIDEDGIWRIEKF